MENEHGGARQGAGKKRGDERLFLSGFFVTRDRKVKLDKVLAKKKLTKTKFFSDAIDKERL